MRACMRACMYVYVGACVHVLCSGIKLTDKITQDIGLLQ